MTDFRGQFTPQALLERELRGMGNEAQRQIDNARNAVGDAAHTAGLHAVGRALTAGELGEIRWMFGTTAGIERARVFPHNFWAPFPNRRAMTPDGNIYFHGDDYREDFSSHAVPLRLRALFLHESTHLYQHYVLGYRLMISGPFDRNYAYELEPGKKLRDYGIEQMGQIVEDFYTLRHGGIVRGKPYSAGHYAEVLPVRAR
jgi:hypothetical protein